MVRVGIAGIGYIAGEYLRLFAQGKIPNASVRALSSRNYAHMEAVRDACRLKDVLLFSDYDAMLASGEIDAVIICTPHFCHPDMAVRALEKGLHTLIEKPIGVFPDELDALLRCAERHPELRAGVLYCRRGGAAFQHLKRLLDEGALGALRRVTWLVTEMYRPQAYFDAYPWKGTFRGEGGGLLMTQVSHQLDLLVWLCGLPRALQAFCRAGQERGIQVENEACVFMEYPDGAWGQFIASSRECPGSSRLEIAGTRGQAVLEDYSVLRLRLLQQDERDYSAQNRETYGRVPHTEQRLVFPAEENTVLQAHAIHNFITAAAKGAPVLCPVAEAVQTQQLIQTAYLSAWTRQMLLVPADAAAFTRALRQRMA